MYLPPQFVAKDADLVRQLMREHPFATLVSAVPTATTPFISQLPIVSNAIDSDPILLGHLAKPNPHSKVLFESGTHQLLFSGPNAYMSPSVYEDKNKVPTWTYLSVLVTGTMTPVVGHAGLDALREPDGPETRAVAALRVARLRLGACGHPLSPLAFHAETL